MNVLTNLVVMAKNSIGRSKGYGCCSNCQDTWDWKDHHTTDYKFSDMKDVDGNVVAKNIPTAGIFPLCEECWASMTPEERWPFYEQCVRDWNDASRLEDIPLIKVQVMEGK